MAEPRRRDAHHTSPLPVSSPELGGCSLVFFDGDCGLCLRSVRFLLHRDPDGTRFRFAPLRGSTCAETLSETVRAGLPDSLVVITPERELLLRSQAALHLGSRLHVGWRLLSGLGRLVPRGLSDRLYDAIARRRRRFFGGAEACELPTAQSARRLLP